MYKIHYVINSKAMINNMISNSCLSTFNCESNAMFKIEFLSQLNVTPNNQESKPI